jgi:hypothetical protein
VGVGVEGAWSTAGDCSGLRLLGYSLGIPHLAKSERDTPSFLLAAPDNAACAPFCKERRMKFADPRSPTGNRGYGAPSDLLEVLIFKSFGGASPRRFRPTYALANVGHPSFPLLFV